MSKIQEYLNGIQRSVDDTEFNVDTRETFKNILFALKTLNGRQQVISDLKARVVAAEENVSSLSSRLRVLQIEYYKVLESLKSCELSYEKEHSKGTPCMNELCADKTRTEKTRTEKPRVEKHTAFSHVFMDGKTPLTNSETNLYKQWERKIDKFMEQKDFKKQLVNTMYYLSLVNNACFPDSLEYNDADKETDSANG
jgi:hypothetical protein